MDAATSVKEAARLMYLNKVSGLPVLNKEDQLVGILTEADMVRTESPIHLPTMFGFLGSLIYLDNPLDGDEIQKQLEKITATKVEELMTEDVVTIEPDASLDELAEIFLHKKVNPVPVMAGNKLVGIVSRSDIVKLVAGEGIEGKGGSLIKK